MAITIGNPEIRPELIFNNVFMERLAIDQVIVTDNTASPIYKVNITYWLYAVVGDTRKFEERSRSLSVTDFIALAYEKASGGDPDLLNAFISIQGAVALLLSDLEGLDTEVV